MGEDAASELGPQRISVCLSFVRVTLVPSLPSPPLLVVFCLPADCWFLLLSQVLPSPLGETSLLMGSMSAGLGPVSHFGLEAVK